MVLNKAAKVLVTVSFIAVWSAAIFYVGWQSPSLFGKGFHRDTTTMPTAKYYPLKRTVVTVAGEDYPHYLLLEMSIKSSSEEVKRTLEEADSLVRNTLMKLFAKKQFEELNNPNHVDTLQQEVQLALSKVLNENHYDLELEQVLFTRMVIQ
ncbi:flagellar basal body protein FliL [Shewanella sp. OPT22]|nr:flagellar basal body protein FliL [Shewanella sp. OPT22]